MTGCEILVTSAKFLVALVTRKVQFWTLDQDIDQVLTKMSIKVLIKGIDGESITAVDSTHDPK